jgi:hypothetical protein
MKAARQWKLVGTREDDRGQYDPNTLCTSIKTSRQPIKKAKGNYLTRGVGRKKGSKWGISKGN